MFFLSIINSNRYSNQSERSVTQLPENSKCLVFGHAAGGISSLCPRIPPATQAMLGLQIDEKDISISHRLPHKVQNETYSSRLRPREGASSVTLNSSNRFPKIIVKFARRSVKDQFYQGRKYVKDKSTKDLGFSLSLDGHIFISESLTSKNKELFKDCLKFKKDHSFRYIWTQSGCIYLKKNKDLPTHVISSKEDLDVLLR